VHGARSLSTRLVGFAAAAFVAFGSLSGCEEVSGDTLYVTLYRAGPHTIFVPANINRVELDGESYGGLWIKVEQDSTWQLTIESVEPYDSRYLDPSPDRTTDPTSRDCRRPGYAGLEWEERNPSVREYTLLACMDVEGAGVCTEDNVTPRFMLLANDLPPNILPMRVSLPNPPTNTLQNSSPPPCPSRMLLERVDEPADLLMRGGRWAPLTSPTCDEVDAAGSLDDWIAIDPVNRQAEVDAACLPAGTSSVPTGDYRCDVQDVEIQCT